MTGLRLKVERVFGVGWDATGAVGLVTFGAALQIGLVLTAGLSGSWVWMGVAGGASVVLTWLALWAWLKSPVATIWKPGCRRGLGLAILGYWFIGSVFSFVTACLGGQSPFYLP